MTDIKTVQERHTPRLMAIEGVVGTAIGQLDDGRDCILVFVVQDSGEIRARIPATLDGYPVKVQVTGEIVPH